MTDDWGDLQADVRHTTDTDTDETDDDGDDGDESESKPRLDGVGRLIASWGSWREYKGK